MPFPLNSGLGGFSSNTVVSGQQAGIGNSPEFTGLTFEPYIIELPVADPSFAGSTPIFVNDLTGDSGLDPTISLSRASTAWDFDKNGNVVSFANDVPRIGWDSDGLGNFVKNGVLIEEQRTNLAVNSGDLTSAWTVFTLTRSSDTTRTPHGTTAAKYTETTTASTTHGVFNNAQFAISSGSVYTVSIFQHAGTKQFVYLAFQDNGSGTNYISAVFNLTGVAPTTATQTSSGLSGSLLSTSQTYMGNGWYRLTITGSITSAAAFMLFGPAAAATGNTLDSGGLPVFTGSTANTFYASLPQVELGAFATSPIITGATAVTRSADIMSSTDAGLLGALAWSIETASMKAATAATILGVNTGVGIQARADNTLGYDSTGAQVTANIADWTAVNRSFFAFDGTPRVSIGLDGGTVVTAATSPVTPTTLYFGNTNNGASGFLNGRLRRFAAYTSLTDTQGAAASTPNASFMIATGGPVAVNAALAATEAPDVAALVVTETINAALAATEAPDVAVLVVTETINAALAATEAPDVAAFVVTETINAALAATEAQDVAAFVVAVKISAALAATEAPDTAAFVISVGDNAALAATEAQDTAALVVIETDTAVLAATEAKDVAAFVVTETINAALAATEASDTAAFVATIGDNAALAATEAKDVAALIVIETDTAVLAATEAQDVAVFVANLTINAALAAAEAKDVASINASGGINVALAATEAQDVAAFVAIETDTAILTATEAPDVASIVATVSINAALSAAETKDIAAFTVSMVSAGVGGSFAVVEAPDTVHFLINYVDGGLPTSKFIYPRVKEPYDPNLDLTIMRKAFTSKNWENYLRLVNVRGNDVYGYNGEVSQNYLTAEPMLDPITGALAINFLVNDGRQFLVDIPDDMPGIYRGVLMGMIEA